MPHTTDYAALRQWFDANVAHTSTATEYLSFGKNYDWATTVSDTVALLHGEGWDDENAIISAPIPQRERLILSVEAQSDGDTYTGFNLEYSLPADRFPHLNLSRFVESDEITNDTEASGVEGLWNLIEAIAQYWDSVWPTGERLRSQ